MCHHCNHCRRPDSCANAGIRAPWPQSSKFVAQPQPEMRTKESEPRRKNNPERGRAASSKNCLSWHCHRTMFHHLGSPPDHQVKFGPQPDEVREPNDIPAPSRAAAAPPARQLQEWTIMAAPPPSENRPTMERRPGFNGQCMCIVLPFLLGFPTSEN